MVDVITGIYDFTLPEVGGSDDTWGDKLNANWLKMETLLAAGFPGGSPAKLGPNLRLDALAVGNLGDISVINPTDPLLTTLRIGRSSPTGNINVYLMNPGTTTVRVQLKSEGTGTVIAGVGEFGNYRPGLTVGGTVNADYFSTIDGKGFYLQSGAATGTLLQVRNSANILAAIVDVGGTAMTTSQSVVTLEKGDARYFRLGNTGTQTAEGALEVGNVFGGSQDFTGSGNQDISGYNLSTSALTLKPRSGLSSSGDVIAMYWSTTKRFNVTRTGTLTAYGSVNSTAGGFDGNTLDISGAATLAGAYANTTTSAANMVMGTATPGRVFRSTSSGRFKIERTPIPNPGAIIDALDPLSFQSTHEVDEGRRFTGFVAEDVAAAFPEASSDNGENYDVRALVAALWAEVRQHRTRIATLEATP